MDEPGGASGLTPSREETPMSSRPATGANGSAGGIAEWPKIPDERSHPSGDWVSARSPAGDLRRRYTDAQVSLALALIAEGKTLKQTAAAVGAPAHTVNRWLKRAGRRRLSGRQRYTAGEIGLALTLVDSGASLRQAGAAVGASNATVLRWLRNAA